MKKRYRLKMIQAKEKIPLLYKRERDLGSRHVWRMVVATMQQK
jgi:hypothetical protein